MKRLGLVWFRNNLRLHDNEVGCDIALDSACPLSHKVLVWAHANNDFVNHLYCFDPRQITEKTYKCDFVKCDKHRLKFLIETVGDLRTSLVNKSRFESDDAPC